MTNPHMNAQAHILENIDGEGYDVTLNGDKEKVQFLLDTFLAECGWNVERVGFHRALADWFAGLPTACTIAFKNHEVLELGKAWGELADCSSEARGDIYLNNWFARMARAAQHLMIVTDVKATISIAHHVTRLNLLNSTY